MLLAREKLFSAQRAIVLFFFFFKNLTDSSFDLDKRCRTPFVSIKKSDVAYKEEKATLARKQTDRFIW